MDKDILLIDDNQVGSERFRVTRMHKNYGWMIDGFKDYKTAKEFSRGLRKLYAEVGRYYDVKKRIYRKIKGKYTAIDITVAIEKVIKKLKRQLDKKPDPVKIVEEMKKRKDVNITGKSDRYEQGYNYGFKMALEEVLKRLGGKQ